MKKKIKLTEIIDKAWMINDAKKFAKYLDENKINWTMLDCNIMDYNDGIFNISLDDYDDQDIFFADGKYAE